MPWKKFTSERGYKMIKFIGLAVTAVIVCAGLSIYFYRDGFEDGYDKGFGDLYDKIENKGGE